MNRRGAFIAYTVSCGVLILASCVGDDPGVGASGATDDSGSDGSTGETSTGADSSGGDGATIGDAGADASKEPPAVGTFEWGASFDPESTQASIAYDNAGNIYVGFTYTQAFHLDATTIAPYAGATNDNDFLVASYSSAGTLRWYHPYGTTTYEQVNDITSDGTDIFIGGQFHGTSIDFGNSVTVTRVATVAEYEPFVAKLRGLDGQAVWADNFAITSGTMSANQGCYFVTANGAHLGVGCISDRSLAFAKSSGGTATIPLPTPATGNLGNFFFASLDPATGKASWANAIGADGSNVVNGLAVASDGAMIMTITATGSPLKDNNASLNFTNPRGDTHSTALALKVASDTGNSVWTTNFNDTAANNIVESGLGYYGIGVTSKDDVVVSGMVIGTVPIGGKTVTSKSGTQDAFVAKLAGATGTVAWASLYGGTGNEQPAALAIDAFDNIFIAAGYASTDFGVGTKTLPSPGTEGAFLIKLDPDGNPYWGVGTYAIGDATKTIRPLPSGDVLATSHASGAVSWLGTGSPNAMLDFGDAGVTLVGTSVFLETLGP